MKHFFLFIFIINFFVTQAQEEVLTFTQDDGTDFLRSKDGYSFSNELNNDLAIVFIDRKSIFANLFDANYKKIRTASGDALKNKYSEIIGYKLKGNVYTIIAANNNKNKFAFQEIDFDNESINVQEIKFDFKKETFLSAVQYKNNLILLTATRNNEFILRTIDTNLDFKILKKFEIDYTKRKQRLLRSGFFEVGMLGKPTSNTTKIDNRAPSALEQNAQANKIYQANDKLYLTIENEKELFTSLHSIDINLLTLTTEIFEYPSSKIEDFKTYNSFILDDKIIQIGSNKLEMKIEIKDFNNSLIKDFYFHKNQPIPFKNSPIIQEGTAFIFNNRREMEETSKYLRKVTSGNIGITAYKKEGNINLQSVATKLFPKEVVEE